MHTHYLRDAVRLTDYALQVQQKQLTSGEDKARDDNKLDHTTNDNSSNNDKNYFNDE